MYHASLRRKLAFLLLLALFTGPWAAQAGQRAGDHRPRPAAAAPLELAGRLWTLLTQAWNKTGCYIDPNGRCIPSAPAATPAKDEGCYIDPNGRCIS